MLNITAITSSRVQFYTNRPRYFPYPYSPGKGLPSINTMEFALTSRCAKHIEEWESAR